MTELVIQTLKTLLSDFDPTKVAGVSADPDIYIFAEEGKAWDATKGEIVLKTEELIRVVDMGTYEVEEYLIDGYLHFEDASDDVILKLQLQEIRRFLNVNNVAAARTIEVYLTFKYDGNYRRGIIDLIFTVLKRPVVKPT